MKTALTARHGVEAVATLGAVALRGLAGLVGRGRH